MRDVLVLGYHAVSEDWTSDLAVTPAALERQVSTLLRRGYSGASFHRAVTDPPSARTLAVTFDDAYRSVRELALPILEKLGLPATVFVPTQFATGDARASWPGIDVYLRGPNAHELAVMSWEELRELSSLGWEIGSHTRSHPHLPELAADRLQRELEDSREDCERELGRPCPSIAFPYGGVDGKVVAATKAAGYLTAAGLPRFARMHAPNVLNWPRVGVFNGDSALRFALKVSPTGRRLRALRSGAGAESAEASAA